MHNQILDMCREVLAQGLPVSCVSARSTDGGASWAISLSINAYIDDRESDGNIGKYAVTVDRSNLPAGVACSGISRWPDRETIIIATEQEIKSMIREISEIGKAKDWARFARAEDTYIAYITKPRSPAWWWITSRGGNDD